MNSLQRAWRSAIRKPIKSILLLLVMVTISLFILCGMACRNASVQTQDTTRQAIGAGLRLDGNEKNRSKRLFDCSKMIGKGIEGTYGGVTQKKIETAYGTQWMTLTDNSFDSLQIADIEEIAEVPGISDYNISTCITPVHPVGFERIEDPDVDQHSDLGGVVLIGNQKMELDFNVLSGNVTIKDGRMVTENDHDVCVISEQLANYNHLDVGDTVGFNDYHDPINSQIREATIIGIYQTKQFMSPLMAGDTFRSENVIFTDLRFPEKAEGSENAPCFEHAYFQVGDVDEYDSVKAAVEAVNIDWERYDLIDRNGNMSTMSTNFNDLENISTLLIIITFVAGFFILFFIFIFWTKNRNYEIGILLSLGCKKHHILGQLFIEALITVLLAFAISFTIAPAASGAAADYLVAAQVEQDKLQKNIDADKVAYASENSEQTVVGVDVEITNEMFLICGAGTIVLVAISIGAAGISVLKKNPKDILSELS